MVFGLPQITAKIGRVPWKWYENYKHMGYDADMQKVQKIDQGNRNKTNRPNIEKTEITHNSLYFNNQMIKSISS